MNICMLAYAHYLNDARIKSYVRTLEAEGHRVDVIALRSDGEPARDTRPLGTTFRLMRKYQGQNIGIYLCYYLSFFVLAALLLARRSLVSRYDVVHVHNMPNALVFAALVPKLSGAKIVLDVHDLMTVNYMAKFDSHESALAVRLLKWEQQISAFFANHVLCADHNQKDYLIASCHLSPRKVDVMMNLPAPGLLPFVASTTREDNHTFRIVYHGTIAYRLGIDLILKAISKASPRIPVQLWIYGAGDYLPAALALSSELDLTETVHFSCRFFPVEQIPQIVSGMDLGIIGNRRTLACDKYMLPVKLLEYVYLGIPVLAPRLQVIRRYFDCSMVRFYDPENIEEMADAIVNLYHNREQRGALARAASSFYTVYTTEKQARRYLELLSGCSAA